MEITLDTHPLEKDTWNFAAELGESGLGEESIISGNADLSMILSLTAGMSFSDLPLRDLPIL